MIDQNFRRALKTLHGLFEKNKIKWAVIGSSNMAIQGMQVVPNDLDIFLTLKDLRKSKKIFSVKEITKLNSLTDEPAWEIETDINGVPVHILGERDTGEYCRKFLKGNITRVKADDITVPCFTLEAEAQAYEETKRQHKADMIRQYLRTRSI